MIKSPPTSQDIGYSVAANFGGNPELARVVAAIACAVRVAALEEAAQVVDSRVDIEWPGDDLSTQARSIASDIRALKGEE